VEPAIIGATTRRQATHAGIPAAIAFRRLIADRGAPEQEAPSLPSRRTIVIALLGLILMPTSSRAHAILVKSDPPIGGNVPPGTVQMSFSYNSRIDRARSRLTLTRPDHSHAVLTIAPSGPPDLLQTSAELKTPGAYVVRWQVLAVDGHITRGDVPFTVTDH
jgi:methionine-rich copper-binding protein CopC